MERSRGRLSVSSVAAAVSPGGAFCHIMNILSYFHEIVPNLPETKNPFFAMLPHIPSLWIPDGREISAMLVDIHKKINILIWG